MNTMTWFFCDTTSDSEGEKATPRFLRPCQLFTERLATFACRRIHVGRSSAFSVSTLKVSGNPICQPFAPHPHPYFFVLSSTVSLLPTMPHPHYRPVDPGRSDDDSHHQLLPKTSSPPDGGPPAAQDAGRRGILGRQPARHRLRLGCLQRRLLRHRLRRLEGARPPPTPTFLTLTPALEFILHVPHPVRSHRKDRNKVTVIGALESW